jgi:purine-nucleoside phosphorylase
MMAGSSEERRDVAGQYDVLNKAADAVAGRAQRASVGVVLGSGLSEALDNLDQPHFVGWGEIAGMPKPTTEGHRGSLLSGLMDDLPVLAMCGRVHMYEDRPNDEVAAPIRLLSLMGVHTLVVTSAVGSVDPDIAPGTFVLIEDHINLSGRNVLSGDHDPRFGPRFPDMTRNYDRELMAIFERTAEQVGVPMTRGKLVHTLGPSYETPAEVTLAATLGAKVVSMSMVPDVLTARQRGMRVVGLGCVTNFGSGLTDRPLGHEEVLLNSAELCAGLKSLLNGALPTLTRDGR